MDRERKSGRSYGSLRALSAAVLALAALATASADEHDRRMTLHSDTFENGGTLPLSMINTILGPNGQNTCTASGAPGLNESPQLTWNHAPHDTQSFVVIVYDVTAQFTHWAMYNIAADTTRLPENAGIPGSSIYGVQNGNDFFVPGYDGPCPPPFEPPVHKYTFTVYALDRTLPIVPTFGVFVPAGPEGIYHELISAARDGHVLASATIVGYYSSVAQ